jgi:aminopeptidase YwaD
MTTKIRSLQSLVLALALTASAFAQQPSAYPSPARLHQIVEYLASDMLEGRRTGTAAANDAAHYIAGEFSLLGLRPGMGGGGRTRGEVRSRYLQSFPYVSGVSLGNKNSLVLNAAPGSESVHYRVKEDWMPLGFSSNASLHSASFVFAGFGISSAELKYDDYAVSNVRGKIAVVFSGTPDGDNPHGQFSQAGQLRFKAAAARAAGALALLIISEETNLKDERLARLSYDNAGEAGIPVVVILPRTAASILRTEDVNLKEYQLVADARKLDANSPNKLRLPAIGAFLDLDVEVARRDSPSFNVVGILPGSDPKLKSEAIVIGAHYDHLGRGGEGSLAAREGEVHHGADDNASGVAGLLELARMFSQGPKPHRTIVFIAFSGEEEGLIGSNYYVNHPVLPLTNTVAMINLDMIGRLKDRNLIIGGMGTASEWPATVQTNVFHPASKVSQNVTTTASNGVAKSTGLPVAARLDTDASVSDFNLTLNQDGFGPSDHSSFYAKQIPVLFFWTGTHNDYHKPSDTADKINYEGEARIVAFIARIVRDVDKNEKRPTYAVAKSESQGRASGFRVYLGTIPNYAESNDGLKIDGVRDNSPAAKAGLQAGDKIVKIAGRDVKNVYDYTQALGEMKAGQEYEVEVVRGSERLKLKLTPEARK